MIGIARATQAPPWRYGRPRCPEPGDGRNVRRWIARDRSAHAAFLGVRWLSTDVMEAVVRVQGGVKSDRGAARAARAYVERDRSRADDYYLGEGTGTASGSPRPRLSSQEPVRWTATPTSDGSPVSTSTPVTMRFPVLPQCCPSPIWTEITKWPRPAFPLARTAFRTGTPDRIRTGATALRGRGIPTAFRQVRVNMGPCSRATWAQIGHGSITDAGN